VDESATEPILVSDSSSSVFGTEDSAAEEDTPPKTVRGPWAGGLEMAVEDIVSCANEGEGSSEDNAAA
jgi:hypothetical protein